MAANGPRSPRRVEGWRTAGLWALLALCGFAWTIPQVSIDYRRNRWIESEALLFLPTGQYLRAVSLGHQDLVADLLYLWSIQYYGHHRTTEGRRYLWRIYEVITDLDPQYQDAYLTGALVMAVDMNDPELAIQLLERGAAANPGHWIYLVEAAHYAWMGLEDYPRAAAYFDRALQVPGVPPMVRRARAGMIEFSGDAGQALTLWVEIWRDAVETGDEHIEAIAWQHVYDLDVEADMQALRQAIDRYRLQRGTLPRTLDDLVVTGLLRSLPRTAADEDYGYDPGSGGIVDPREGRSRARR